MICTGEEAKGLRIVYQLNRNGGLLSLSLFLPKVKYKQRQRSFRPTTIIHMSTVWLSSWKREIKLMKLIIIKGTIISWIPCVIFSNISTTNIGESHPSNSGLRRTRRREG